MYSAYELLNRKRRGEALKDAEIRWLVDSFTAGALPDYQMSAFLMAVAIHGMHEDEMAALTRSMLESGERWNLHNRFDFIADKHSTGGVGDKVSILLAPWVAACGVKIGMLSGRGLGHTCGTIDKLDAIPRFNARLTREQLERCIDEVGCAIATSTKGIAPADQKMYGLRDVTGTVESLPLITASIMSKKLAMGASALVLDVKTGSGAFMHEYESSLALARSLIAAAKGSGTRVEALITDMDRPLGTAAGNANEIRESIECLRTGEPDVLLQVTRELGVRVLVMSGKFDDSSAGKALDDARKSGAALDAMRRWIAAQGGDPEIVDRLDRLALPTITIDVRAPRSGFLSKMDTYALGMLAVDLGAGRHKYDDAIDSAAGILFDRKSGDEVSAGEVIARLQIGKRPADDDEVRARYLAAIEFADGPPPARPLVHEHLF